ncbi:MAG: hypothetical protein KDH15_11015 [Rhodocyclaceae bacterium]|nr:hypothetical protein [Rhodocyclaceae bacterium]
MTFREVRFARELAAVIVGLLSLVGTVAFVAFVAIAATLRAWPGEPVIASAHSNWHPS